MARMVMAADKGTEELRFSMLWLISYLFLLRLPSEVGSFCTYHSRVRVDLFASVPGFADAQVRAGIGDCADFAGHYMA